MKKRYLIYPLIMMILFSGCASIKNPINSSEEFSTQSMLVDTDITTNSETDTDLENLSSVSTERIKMERESVAPTDVFPEVAGDVMSYHFKNIQDMETCMFTDSRDEKDYIVMPDPLIWKSTVSNKNGTVTMAEYMGGKYCSLKTAFGVDADQIDSFDEAVFYLMSKFVFRFGRQLTIEMTYAPGYCRGRTAKDYYDQKYQTDIPLYESVTMSFFSDNGISARKCGNTNVVYDMRDGYRYVTLIADDYLIRISCAKYVYPDQEYMAEELFQQFLTSPEFTPFAELFSPDDAVFQARVNSVIQNISNRYQD